MEGGSFNFVWEPDLLYINSGNKILIVQKNKRRKHKIVVFLLILILCCLIFGGKVVGISIAAIVGMLAALVIVCSITGSGGTAIVIVCGGIFAWVIYDFVKKK